LQQTLRFIAPALLTLALGLPALAAAQQTSSALPDDPSAVLIADARTPSPAISADAAPAFPFQPSALLSGESSSSDEIFPQQATAHGDPAKTKQAVPVDADGNPIPIERQQPTRILGFMPNFRTVSAGSKPHPPGWKYNFTVATHQATDYSTFIFLGLTSLYAEGTNAHPALGKGADGFYAYTWRGFLDKTDGTYLSAWLLASLLHEDTRFYPLGNGHRIITRELYVISRQGITRTYSGHETPAIATLGGKALTQLISRSYYPTSAGSFSVLATKFGYSVMRDVMFSNIREFYPDIAAHYIKKHREKVAAASARDASAQPVAPSKM
jgi:hypothetical protein